MAAPADPPAAPPTDRAIRRRLLRIEPSARPAGALVLLAAVLAAGGVVGQALALAALLTDAFTGTGSPATPALWLAVAVAVRGGAGWLQAIAAQHAAAGVKLRLRTDLLRAAARSGPYAQHAPRTGEFSTLLTRGLDALDPYLIGYLPQLLLAALAPAAVAGAMLAHDPLSGVVLLVTLPLIPLFGALVGLHTRDATARQWAALSRLGGHFHDALRGLTTLRTFGRAEAQEALVGEVADRHRRATLRTLRIAFLSTLVLDTVATLSVALIAVPVGLRLLNGSLGLETALVVLLLAPEAYLPLRALGNRFHAGTEGLTTAREAFALLDAGAGAGPGAQGTRPGGRTAPDSRTGHPAIRFDHVTVALPGRPQPLLKDVSFTVGAGERIALTGPSGAGKSTLIALLLGLVRPQSGRILIDGEELDGLDPELWRRSIGWVPQRPHLFDRSVADNIRLGDPAATDRQVEAAARTAAAHDFICALPQRYDTRLGVRGTGLSVGQRQRIALARAFLRDAPLVLLDEPTAGLDHESEAAVLAASSLLTRGRTVLVVAHRPALLADADRRFDLDGGILRELATTKKGGTA
ncbi:thiol reductant ABC exporter subunit CydD [Streptomyces sp. NPDC050738]|uniref:thiol reductant ABC exporter subunit CydD n=1 Tax=Streptomyces sp. NPDC050738 TaxID=3154744 RepID=UPI00342ECB12